MLYCPTATPLHRYTDPEDPSCNYILKTSSQEPVTLEEVKAYLRISSEQEDGLLKTLISSARSYVEGATGRALLKQGWVLHLTPPYPPFPPCKE